MRNEKSQEEGDSFIRWQSITLSQLTYAVNLILGLSVASLGFGVSLLINPEFNPEGLTKCIFLISLLAILASVAFGIWCVINRLRDFRITKDIARGSSEQNKIKEKIGSLRELSTSLGLRTWKIFWWQIGMFGAGVLLMVASIAISFSTKLP